MAEGVEPQAEAPRATGRIRNPQDFYGGLVLVVFAAVRAVGEQRSRRYSRLRSSGPARRRACLPAMLGIMGIIVTLMGYFTDGPVLQRYAVRGPLFVIAAILFFAAAIRPLGLVFTSFVTIMIAAAASEEVRWKESIIWAAALTAILFAAVQTGARPAAAILAGMADAAPRNVSRILSHDGSSHTISLSALASPFTPMNLALCLMGTLVGTLVGVLPGVGPLATIAMLLPITFGLPPVGALIMLAGIYYGAQYGGSTTSILVNIPGEASSVVTTLDGHQMAKQGRAGPALAIAAIGSFFAGSRGDRSRRGARRAAHGPRAQIRSGGIFLADGARSRFRGGAGEGIGSESDHHDPVRAVALDGRLRSRDRRLRAWPSTFRNWPTASASSPSRWACSASPKSSAISNKSRAATLCRPRSPA